ncbi:MAG: hypothetical protein ACPG6B_05050 [Oceanihabitans sp.]
MFTSIFTKSKPIIFIIVFVATILAFLMLQIKQQITAVTPLLIGEVLFGFLLICFTILLLQFIVIKNKLSLKSNFEILFFSLFLLLLPEALLSSKIILANLFVLLALRRLISISSNINVQLKLFDAAFYIALATLCYFWAIVFVLLIFIVLVFYANNNFKDWFIPFVGLGCVFVLNISASILWNGDFLGFLNFNYNVDFKYINYNNPFFLIAFTILFSLGLWASIYFIKNIKLKTRKHRVSFRIVFVSVLLAFSIVIVSPLKNGSEFLFLFAPLAIIKANYIEHNKDKWFKEIFFAVLIFTPIILLMLYFFTKS